MTIRTGDWVMVVKPATCGCPSESMGKVHRVTGFYPAAICTRCAQEYGPVALVDDLWGGYEIHRLRKIDPLTEPADIVEELHAERPKRVIA